MQYNQFGECQEHKSDPLFIQVGFLPLPSRAVEKSLTGDLIRTVSACVTRVIVHGFQTCCRDSTVDSSCSRLDSSSSHLQHTAKGAGQ